MCSLIGQTLLVYHMRLSTGDRRGPREILTPIGVRDMGEVIAPARYTELRRTSTQPPLTTLFAAYFF
jgi:hypothetical protein